MKIPDMSVKQVWQAWCVVAAALALPILVFGGAGSAAPSGAADRELGSDIPEMPAAMVLAADREELAAGTLWANAETATGPATPGSAGLTGSGPGWLLAGVYMKEQRREVVLRYTEGVKPPTLLREGDSLPDGSRIGRIERDRVELRSEDESAEARWVYLNRGGEGAPRAD